MGIIDGELQPKSTTTVVTIDQLEKADETRDDDFESVSKKEKHHQKNLRQLGLGQNI